LGNRSRRPISYRQTLEACGVDIIFDQQAIDTTTPMGKCMFSIAGAFAEFERSMFTQRVHAGLARARKAGKTLGRPEGAIGTRREKG
jgi:DNA invertase Pin-like site-specific DNA recombinase